MTDNILKNTWSKVVIGLVLFLLFLLALGYYLANHVLPNRIDEAMRKAVSESIGEQYQLEYDEMEIGLLDGDVILSGIRLYAPQGIDSAERHVIDSLSVAQLAVRGVDAFAYLFNNKININGIQVTRPWAWLRPAPQDTASTASEKSKKSKGIESFALGELEITEAKVLYYSALTGNDALHAVSRLDFTLSDMKYQPNENSSDIMKSVNWGNAKLHLEEFIHKTPKRLFTMRLQSLSWSSGQDMVLDSFSMIPIPAKYKFHEIVGHQTDRITTTVRKVSFRGMDIEKMLATGSIDVRAIDIADVDFHTFRDKRYPYPKVSKSKMPKAMLQRLPITVNIDTVNLSNTRITYEEHPEKGDQTGEIFFSDLHGTITTISNDTARRKGKKMEVEASAYVMGKGKLEASIDFPYDKSAGVHMAKGRMGPMDLTAINAILVAYNVKINTGQANGIDFTFDANDDFSTGQVTLLYENLDITLPTASKAGIIGSVLGELGELGINQLIIKDKNTAEGDGPRVGNIDFKRDKRKSIFNYWWYSLESGLVECLVSESVYNMMQSTGVMDKMLYGGRESTAPSNKEERKNKREEGRAESKKARADRREKKEIAEEKEQAQKKKASQIEEKAKADEELVEKTREDSTKEDRNIFEKVKDKASDIKDGLKKVVKDDEK